MFYHLFTYFNQIPGARLLQYISFRSIVALILALFISFYFGEFFIKLMNKRHVFEQQRDSKIDPFNVSKMGVPTMGGIVIIVSILVPCLLVGNLGNIYLQLLFVTTLLLGSVGFADDYIKTFKHKKDGLNGWWKIGMQVLLGLIIGLTLRYSPEVTMHERVSQTNVENVQVIEKTPGIKSTQTTVPFFKNHNWNYSEVFAFLGKPSQYRAGWILFVIMTILVVAAVSNGANLNDGMDGMLSGNAAIIGVALLILAYITGNTIWANYFDVMYIPGSQEIAVFLAAFIGALIGFLWYNAFPAQIFMGDTGSLTIGGIIAVSAIIIHKELLLPVLCGVFLMESVSVIMQTQVYRFYKKRGKRVRIFKRTPFHDHFRTSVQQVLANDPTCQILFKGNSTMLHENKIMIRFCIATLLLAVFTILTLKIR